MTNRLSLETSPYLLQHRDNPVNWYAWGKEAFETAQAENRPIFLSIGYSACHWCHVMAHESFEDAETARFLNDNFVSIKVDREEHPDVDSIYMNAVQALSGSGGWPMSVFLLPDGRPFYGGTYFPKTPRYGMPSFLQILERVAAAFRQKQMEISRDATNLTRAINRAIKLDSSAATAINSQSLQSAFQRIAASYDQQNGGFGAQPKFPPTMLLEFLMRLYVRFGWRHALDMVTHTLDRMTSGGIYDQIGGGFHRYSTDSQWLVPHFEKMLYDNALLLRVYLYAFQITGNPRYKLIVDQTIEYVRRELTDVRGGFHASQDADSEGREGEFYVWKLDELRHALKGHVHVDAVLDYWGVSGGPNFEGRNILWVPDTHDQIAARHSIGGDKLTNDVSKARKILLALRGQRIAPGQDTKILTAWNGLMIASLAQIARVMKRPQVLEMAVKAAEFVLSTQRQNGRLLRSYCAGQAKLAGYLEDYCFFVEALMELYAATFDVRWYREAYDLTESVVNRFWSEDGGFYDTSVEHEQLIVRPQEVTDNAIPSGTSSAVAVLLRMSLLANRPDWWDKATQVIGNLLPGIEQYPSAFGYLACQLDFAISSPNEIALVGDPDDPAMRKLLDVVFEPYRPNQIVALARPGSEENRLIPLLKDRERLNSKPTAYVCHHFVCNLPVNDAGILSEQLDVKPYDTG